MERRLTMRIAAISSDVIDQIITMKEVIDVSAWAYKEFSRDRVQMPMRINIKSPQGTTLFMPGYLKENGALGVKVVSIFNNNSSKKIPVINAVMLLINSETGQPLAIMDGTKLTAIRTGAASGVATNLLARKDACNFALIGAGGQALEQVRAVMAVRKIKNLSIYSRRNDSALVLAKHLQHEYPQLQIVAAKTPKEAVKGADIITCVTSSNTPVFDPMDVSPGTHINGIGSFSAEMREVQVVGLPQLRVFVDSLEAVLEEGGDLIQAIREGYCTPSDFLEIGEVLLQSKLGRTSDSEITFFKSVGLAVQDTAVAFEIFQKASKSNRVQEVEL
jgi:ornithine cyclodeaminase